MTIEDSQRITNLEQKFRRHIHDDIETDKLDYNSLKNLPDLSDATNSMILESYTTDLLTGFTISDLDLATHPRYKIYIKADGGSSADIPYLQFNGLTTTTYNFMGKRRRLTAGGGFTEGSISGVGVDKIELDSHAHYSYVMELDLSLMDTTTEFATVDFHVRGLGSTADSSDDSSMIDGIGWETSASNLTSLHQGWITDKAFTYKVWVYRFPTS